MTQYKAVLTDLDGTIVASDMTISDASIRTIQHLKRMGIATIPVTGRDFMDIQGVLVAAGIDGLGVFNGGSQIIDISTGEAKMTKCLGIRRAKHIIKEVCLFADIVGFGKGRMPAGTFNLSLVDAPVLGVWAEVMESNLVYIKDLTKKYDDLEIHITSPQASGAYGVHITPPLTNKLTETTELLRQMGVDPKRTLAIGDEDNDIPLFQVGGTCVAMGYASSTLKRLADYTTESIERDGFMHAINKYILNSQASKEV